MSKMSKMPNKTFFITGGGTGGHIYPAVAVADELVKDGQEVYYVGNPKNLEYNIECNPFLFLFTTSILDNTK